jgi:hypothetical protein
MQGRDGAVSQSRHLKAVPEVEHGVAEEAVGDQQSQVGEAKGKREKVHVEKGKVQEEEAREKTNGAGRAHGNYAVDFRDPHHGEDQKRQQLVSIKLDQKEEHAQTDGQVDQGVDQVGGAEGHVRKVVAHVVLEQKREFQHALLRLPQGEAHQRGRREEEAQRREHHPEFEPHKLPKVVSPNAVVLLPTAPCPF